MSVFHFSTLAVSILLFATSGTSAQITSPALKILDKVNADPNVGVSNLAITAKTLPATEFFPVGIVEGLRYYQMTGMNKDGTSYAAPASIVPPVIMVPAMPPTPARPPFALNIKTINELPCTGPAADFPGRADHSKPWETNTHFHGSLVSPRAPTAGDPTWGDYVLDVVNAGDAAGTKCAGSTAAATHIQQKIEFPAGHFSGLMWLHPHVHGFTGTQIMSGLAGLISVGELDYLQNPPTGPVHYLMLKDFQIEQPDATKPWQFQPIFNPGQCNGAILNGYCEGFHPETLKPLRWLFTVNGAIFPTLTVPGSQNTVVLRLANTTANVSYRLQLRTTDVTGAEKCVQMQVLNRDGVPVDLVVPTGPAAVAVACDTITTGNASYLTMPAGRMDLALDRTAICAALGPGFNCNNELTLTMATAGMHTGTAAGVADTWPTMDLARITFAAKPPVVGGPVIALENPAAQNRKLTVKRAVSPLQAGGAVTANGTCADGVTPLTTAQLNAARTGTYRWVGLDVVAETLRDDAGNSVAVPNFLMSTKLIERLAGSNELLYNPTGKPPLSDFLSFNHHRTDMCIGAVFTPATDPANTEKRDYYDEDWVVFNYSPELHNFHIHQSKFSVQAIYMPEPVAQAGRQVPAQGNVYISTAGMTDKGGGEFVSTGAPHFHDTFPVPINGAIHIKVRFYRESAGRFVYHCHILEHEDGPLVPIGNRHARGGGMMGIVELVAP